MPLNTRKGISAFKFFYKKVCAGIYAAERLFSGASPYSFTFTDLGASLIGILLYNCINNQNSSVGTSDTHVLPCNTQLAAY